LFATIFAPGSFFVLLPLAIDPSPWLDSDFAVLDLIKSRRIRWSDDMRKISLSELMVGSVIPPLVVYLARDSFDLAARGFTWAEIAQCLTVSLLVGIVVTFGFPARCHAWIRPNDSAWLSTSTSSPRPNFWAIWADGKSSLWADQNPAHRTIQPDTPFDTTLILFICGGAFVRLEDIIAKRLGRGRFRIRSVVRELPGECWWVVALAKPEDLASFGLIPEIIGRLPVISKIDVLALDDLVCILQSTKGSVIQQFRKLVRFHGADLVFTYAAVKEIAKIALERGTGARGASIGRRGELKGVFFDVEAGRAVRDHRQDGRGSGAGETEY
jgi:hypothetical protein